MRNLSASIIAFVNVLILSLIEDILHLVVKKKASSSSDGQKGLLRGWKGESGWSGADMEC